MLDRAVSAGSDLYTICAMQAGEKLAKVAQFHLSCRYNGDHTLCVVSKDPVTSADHLYASCCNPVAVALQKVSSMVSIIWVVVHLPSIFLISRCGLAIGKDYLL